MSDELNNTNAGQNPAGEQEAQNNGGRQEADKPENKTFSREYVEDLREEAKKYRLKLRELEQQLEQQKQKELEEQKKYQELYEKTKKELEELKEQQELAAFNKALRDYAAKAGLRNPDDIRLANLENVKLENGELTGIDSVIEQLRKERPYLFSEQGAGDNTKGSEGSDNINPDDFSKLSPEQREALLRKAAENFKI